MTGRINENFSMGNVTPLVWNLPALCDLIGTTMMFIALSWTFASSFQMLRGSVIIFTGYLFESKATLTSLFRYNSCCEWSCINWNWRFLLS